MGVTAADYLHDGLISIFRTNFSDELETLYRNVGKGDFRDVTTEAGLGKNTRYVGWGCGFFDFDNDGWPDLLLVNGHAFPEVDRLKIDIHYRERAILYRNDHGRFVDISESAGPGILEAHSSRGLAFADYDNDGTLKALVNSQNEPPSLLRMAGKSANHWIEIKLEGVKSNRSAIGARVRVIAGGMVQTDEVRSGGSYLSQNDLRLHFGLGAADKVDQVEITWPGGRKQAQGNLGADRIVTIREN
jgi:enediyne biosynthesis protein E4